MICHWAALHASQDCTIQLSPLSRFTPWFTKAIHKKNRSLLCCTESCLYVCLQSTTKCRWFTLFRKPDHQTSEAKSSWYVLAPASTLHTPHAMSMFSGIVAVCSDIYNIGSSFSTVSVLDCRSHTWHEGPSLRVKLHTLSASVVDQKIYVAWVHQFYALKKKSSEVLDTTKPQVIWDHVPPIRDTMPCFSTIRSACLDGKFRVARDKRMVCYNSKEGK